MTLDADKMTDTNVQVVMLPGLFTTPEVWDEVIAGMTTRQNMCFIPLACPALETVEAIADALADTIGAQVSGPFHLVGFSFGGFVSLAMLERHPHLLASLTLVGSASHADNAAMLGFRQKCLDAVETGTVEKLAARSSLAALHDESAQDSPLFQRAMKMAADYGAQRFAAHIRACMARPDRTQVLADTDVMLHFVSGEHDAVIPLGLQKRSAAAAGGTLRLVPQSGHLLPLEQPQLLADILDRILAEASAIFAGFSAVEKT